jgi:hypothetical protein
VKAGLSDRTPTHPLSQQDGLSPLHCQDITQDTVRVIRIKPIEGRLDEAVGDLEHAFVDACGVALSLFVRQPPPVRAVCS